MPKESINPPELATPFGPYVHVTKSGPGALVHCSGAVAVDGEGQLVGVGDVAAQTRQVMENLRLALAAAGASFEDVVKINTYVLDAALYPQIAPIREEYLREPYPASTMVEVKGLLYPELMIEIEAVAVVDDGR